MARLKEQWQAEWEVWQSRPLNDLEVVYLWVDGIYVKAGLEKEKAVLLVAEQRFRRLKAPELMKDVYQGAKYVNGVPVNQVPEEKAA